MQPSKGAPNAVYILSEANLNHRVESHDNEPSKEADLQCGVWWAVQTYTEEPGLVACTQSFLQE
jgi:hypothetical protein